MDYNKEDIVANNRKYWMERNAMTPEELMELSQKTGHQMGTYYYKSLAEIQKLAYVPEKHINMLFPCVLHVPHSSTFLPEEAVPAYDVLLAREMAIMTDWFCDDIFSMWQHQMVTSPISRLYCDMERFREDENELMAKVGMGAIYTRCSDGNVLRNVTNDEKEHILQNYYDVHHQKLTDMVEKRLQSFGKCLIIDGHSFHPEPLPHEPDQTTPRPDICIGTDDYHTPEWLKKAAVAYWENLGYTVAVNSPFAGTIVPQQYYRKDKRILSIMLELNRKLYCYMPMQGLVVPNRQYETVKRQVKEFVAKMEQKLI